jgi:2-oxoglutarate ferredoxin oxidoreductase subunit beta
MNGFGLEVVQLGNGTSEKDLIVHDEQNPNPAYAFLLSRMEMTPGFPTPIGVLRAVDEARYEDRTVQQIHDVIAKRGPGDLTKLLRGGDTWEVK